MKRKDLLGLDGVSREEITSILDTALMMRQVVRSNNKKTAHLQGKSIVTLFYENSTRTQLTWRYPSMAFVDTVEITFSEDGSQMTMVRSVNVNSGALVRPAVTLKAE